MQSIDDLVVLKAFPVLEPLVNNQWLKKSLRLLTVFGFNGSEVLFVTKEDLVYGYGHNKFGCLGFGDDGVDIHEPRLNEILSGKQLVNIVFGLGHVIGLTVDGQCYAWGDNKSGQLGIGNTMSPNGPQLIPGFDDIEIKDINCGTNHTLALTSRGQVWAWGNNTLGQTNDRKGWYTKSPICVPILERVLQISCGNSHSLALTSTGVVYMWGHNKYGQLGRHPNCDYRETQRKYFSFKPEVIPVLDGIFIKKGVCGRCHTILLSTEGHIYTFGRNDSGQVGNGCLEMQCTPTLITGDVEFKDIVSTNFCDLSIAVTTNGQYFIWGFKYHHTVMSTPYEVTDKKSTYNLYDLYSHLTAFGRTYKTVVFEVDFEFTKSVVRAENRKNIFTTDDSIEGNTNHVIADQIYVSKDYSLTNDNSNQRLVSGNLFLRHLFRAFNNENNYDLKFVFTKSAIHCHKTILKIRNKKFWHNCQQNLDKESKRLIYIKSFSYESFYAFIQYLYGIDPKINDKNSKELSQLAHIYAEPELKSLCNEVKGVVIDLSNVCSLYEMSITDNNTDLKRNCIEFSQNNWKSIIKSQEFEEMNENIAKEFMKSVIN